MRGIGVIHLTNGGDYNYGSGSLSIGQSTGGNGTVIIDGAGSSLQGTGPAIIGTPSVLIHGRLDQCSPLITPWRLAQNWPGSKLVLIGAAGHHARDLGMSESIVAATDQFARRR